MFDNFFIGDRPSAEAHWLASNAKKQPLCFTAVEPSSTVLLKKLGNPTNTVYLETSRDKMSWSGYEVPDGSGTAGPEIVLSAVGDKVYFREKSDPSRPNGNAVFSTGSESNIYMFKMTGKIAASGNVQTLLKADGSRMDAPDCGFCALFNGCSSLVSVPMLPATTVGKHSYRYMFYNCTSLSAPPCILPAKTLPNGAYAHMFQHTGIQTPPIIMAESIGHQSCAQMFSHCTSLKYAPELQATTLGTQCYYMMFYGCANLEKAPSVLPAKTIPMGAYESMFGNTTIVHPPKIAATVYGESGCCDMFSGCYSLASAPEILAEEVGECCCTSMFWQCRSLSAGPSRLPAKHLAEKCYEGMFESCSSLKVGPVVEAEQMEVDSMYYMYYACSSLTSATLPIDAELADECYGDMFVGCTSLSAIPKLPSPEACSEHSDVVNMMLFNTGRPVQILDNTVDEIVDLIQNEHLIGNMAWTTNPVILHGSDGTISATFSNKQWTLDIVYTS